MHEFARRARGLAGQAGVQIVSRDRTFTGTIKNWRGAWIEMEGAEKGVHYYIPVHMILDMKAPA